MPLTTDELIAKAEQLAARLDLIATYELRRTDDWQAALEAKTMLRALARALTDLSAALDDPDAGECQPLAVLKAFHAIADEEL